MPPVPLLRTLPCGLPGGVRVPDPCCRHPASGVCQHLCGSAREHHLACPPRSNSDRWSLRPHHTPEPDGWRPVPRSMWRGGAATSRRKPPAALPANAAGTGPLRLRRAGSARAHFHQTKQAPSAPVPAPPAGHRENVRSTPHARRLDNQNLPAPATPWARQREHPRAESVPDGPLRYATASFWHCSPADPEPGRPVCAPIAPTQPHRYQVLPLFPLAISRAIATRPVPTHPLRRGSAPKAAGARSEPRLGTPVARWQTPGLHREQRWSGRPVPCSWCPDQCQR